ncbi:hypothetical protein ACHAXT_010960 [Thalassiosira profunda]
MAPPTLTAVPLSVARGTHKAHSRLVVSAASLRGSDDSSSFLGGDGGDVVAEIVGGPPSPDDDCNNGGAGDGGCGSIGGGREQPRRVIVRRMDGRSVASFALPPAAPIQASPPPSNSDGGEPSGWRGYDDPQLCWASFRGANESSGGAAGRKMLCVLGAVSIATDNAGGRSDRPPKPQGDTGGGPAGHTIPLPFQARSIFPAADGDGVLICRMPSEEDFAPQTVAYGGYGEYGREYGGGYGELEVGGAGGMGRGGAPPTPTGLSLPATPRHLRGHLQGNLQGDLRGHAPNPNIAAGDGEADANDAGGEDVHDEELSLELEGPPEPVRLQGASPFAGDELNAGAPVAGGALGDTAAGMGNMGSGNGVACLFSLRHPLDEVRPVAVASDARNVSSADDGGAGPAAALFADVTERVAFVASPRLFHGTLPRGPSGGTTALPLCATFHEGLQRHALWTVGAAPRAGAAPPLWQTTGRGGRGGRADEGTDGTASEGGTGDGFATGGTDDTSMHSGAHHSLLADAAGVPSAFADIHPEFALRRVFVEDVSSSAPDAVPDGVPAATGESYEEWVACAGSDGVQRRHAFLATDARGRGDLVFCAFGPSDPAGGAPEPGVLRCFALHLDGDVNDATGGADEGLANEGPNTIGIAGASPPVDLPCTAARPVRAVPAPLAPLAAGGGTGARSTGRFGAADEHTMATDVLVLRRGEAEGARFPRLDLRRAGSAPIADFCLPEATMEGPYRIAGLGHPAGDRVDIRCVSGEEGHQITTVRAAVSLALPGLAEAAARAIEGSLVPGELAALPLVLRADCLRLFQQGMGAGNGGEDLGWDALTTALRALGGTLGGGSAPGGGPHGRTGLPPPGTTAPRPDEREGREGTKAGTKAGARAAAWEGLLRSPYHAAFGAGEGRALFADGDGDGDDYTTFDPAEEEGDSNAASHPHGALAPEWASGLDPPSRKKARRLVFDALHLLHEECRLAPARGEAWIRPLGTWLREAAEASTDMGDFVEHYRRCRGDGGGSGNASDSVALAPGEAGRMSNFDRCPCILACLDGMLWRGGTADIAGDDSASEAEYEALMTHGLNGACRRTWLALRLYSALFRDAPGTATSDDDGATQQRRRDRATVLAMLDEGVYHPAQLRESLPLGVVLPLLEALGRCRLDPPSADAKGTWPAAAFDLIGRNDLAAFLAPSHGARGATHRDRGASAAAPASDPDPDGLAALEDLAAAIYPADNRIREAGRLLRSSRPLFLRAPRPPELSDHDYEKAKQEKLRLLCRRSVALPLGRGMLTLGTLGPLAAGDALSIPNIVLSGRVPPSNGTLALDMASLPANYRVWPEFHNGVAAGLRLPRARAGRSDRTSITRTWIKFHKPSGAADGTGGGSNNAGGQTPPPPSYAHGGFLLALGLRGHLSALTTTDLTDYLTQGTVTTTVGIFLGTAANKRGTCDPSISKMLCLHVPSLLPQSFSTMELAAPVQAAAVAGIGLLYQGSGHRLTTEFLLEEMGRPPPRDQNVVDREGFALACGLALGMVNLAGGRGTVGGLEDLRIEERLRRYIDGAGDGVDGAESPELNTDVTAPGATLALGLMYIKSHNASVAARLALPATHFLLDYVRPDLLALRVIARALVLWDDVEPSPEWIDAQLPRIVKDGMDAMKGAAKRAVAAADGDQVMDETESNANADEAKKEAANFDPRAVRQANAYVISGACFSLGLKFAGSGNRAAASAIIERALWFLELRDNRDVVTQVQRPDESTLATCLCTAAVSLAMVLAGTGDLDAFRLFRALRWKCDDSALYGAHMAFGAAVGLLFLGGGTCALGSSPEDVAALLASLYPHFPVGVADNQYHLQALRHLYVLAVHERILEAVDVDSGEKVCVPIELRLANCDAPVRASTPFLVANDSRLLELRTKSDRYYPLVVNAKDWSAGGNLSTLFVKQRAGHLGYLQDPNGLRSLSMQTGSGDRASFLKSIALFSNDALLTSFAKNLCFSAFDDDEEFERFCRDITSECLKEEKSEVLPLYLRIFRLIEAGRRTVSIGDVWDARLLRTYSRTRKRLSVGSASPLQLVHDGMIALLCERMESALQLDDSTLSHLSEMGGSEKWWETDPSLGAFFSWHEVP